jgi:two-component system nitrate/nitrite response regulator NarL
LSLLAIVVEEAMDNESVFLICSGRLFREGLSRLISKLFTVVHASSSIEDALPLVASLNPALVLMDLKDCGEALAGPIGRIHTAAPRARIVVLAETIRVDRLADALSAGVDGYLLKNLSGAVLHQSLRLILLGEKVLPTDLADILTNGRMMARGDTGQRGHANGLSDREMQVLALLLNGAPNKRIAYDLKISEGTVKVHLKAILKKIKVHNRTQAAIWALNHGIAGDLGSSPQGAVRSN